MRAARPPLFLIAGGPGQSGTDAFDPYTVERLVGTETRSRDVVVMDLRGTGGSGALTCHDLQQRLAGATAVATCAAKLGSRRDFYSSVEMADDIDAVRAALGHERIAIYGASYGTYIAQIYARRHPARVDRLILDSVVGPEGVDAFERPSMAAAPRVVGRICGRGSCKRFTRDAAADVAALAGRLDRRPAKGLVTDGRGRRHRARIDGHGLLDVLAASDRNPFVAAEIPAAVRSALRGDLAPLLRVRGHSAGAERPPRSPRQLSVATYVATLCSDTRLPWESSTPLAARPAAAATFVAGLPADAFAPFGIRTALDSDVLEACHSWPSRTVAAPELGPLPDVPALLLAGGLDVRTPVDSARAVAAEMPHAHLLVVGNAMHGVVGAEFEQCASRAVRRFLAGGEPGRCGPGPRFSRPFPPLPAAVGDLRPRGGATGRAGRTAQAVRYTFVDYVIGIYGEFFERLLSSDDLQSFFTAPPATVQAGALRGGRYVDPPRAQGVIFDRAVAVRGVRVDGALIWRGQTRGVRGTLRITGASAARGRLTVRRGALVGRLGRQRVRISLKPFADLFGQRAARISTRAALLPRVASVAARIR